MAHGWRGQALVGVRAVDGRTLRAVAVPLWDRWWRGGGRAPRTLRLLDELRAAGQRFVLPVVVS